ncbi:uncharacterized protein LOC134206077 [Armigeres subalbatus]|uniref:uncharacterized protein LOC134206077 n=1 Tax=Armigeres subalbatus TaxID=124917 RepID=UPI002ED0E5F7
MTPLSHTRCDRERVRLSFANACESATFRKIRKHPARQPGAAGYGVGSGHDGLHNWVARKRDGDCEKSMTGDGVMNQTVLSYQIVSRRRKIRTPLFHRGVAIPTAVSTIRPQFPGSPCVVLEPLRRVDSGTVNRRRPIRQHIGSLGRAAGSSTIRRRTLGATHDAERDQTWSKPSVETERAGTWRRRGSGCGVKEGAPHCKVS